MENKAAITQRAYTLRLHGTSSQDQSWRNALWRTHEAVNKGAKVFGDWLLTLCGGIDHALADAEMPQGNGQSTDEERKARRILLALSWLSVESKSGAPQNYIIVAGTEAGENRNRKVIAAFEEILKNRGLAANEIKQWKNDCSASLSAAIRADAVWVNRSRAFDDAVKLIGASLTREAIWDVLEPFLGNRNAYLAPADNPENETSNLGEEGKAKDLSQKAGQWLSSRFGSGKGANFSRMADIYEKIANWAEKFKAGTTGKEAIQSLAHALGEKDILRLVSGPGYKSATRNFLKAIDAKVSVDQQFLADLCEAARNDAEKCKSKIGAKGQRPYADAVLKDVEDACGFTYQPDQDGAATSVAEHSKHGGKSNKGAARHREFAVILDHAARRVSLAHTWVKRAEAERRRLDGDAGKMVNVPPAVKKWLDSFCQKRSESSGALEPYRIRRRAVDGWEQVVAAWSRSSCITSADRIAAVRALQDEPEIEKFGDIQLFEALAADDAVCVWHKDGDTAKPPDHQVLMDYVYAAEAEFKKREFKVPAYCHPDALLHPIFCDFGNSRWRISFAVHQRRRAGEGRRNRRAEMVNRALENMHALSMRLWDGQELKERALCWSCKRLARDLGLCQPADGKLKATVTRNDRLGRAACGVTTDAVVDILNVFKEEHWNGRLQAPRVQLDAIAVRVGKHGWDKKAQRMRDNLHWMIAFSPKFQSSGPWFKYISEISESAADRPFVSFKGDYAVFHADNNVRKGLAKLSLSRLPGLRVLAVDLGHRYAAACAVWETVDAEQTRKICQSVGHKTPQDGDFYLHLKNGHRTVIYRRISADKLPDGRPHPAPWARLDRQFLVKLQGEQEGARAVSNEEIWAVHQMEVNFGRAVPLIDRLVASGWGVTAKQRQRLVELKRLGWQPVAKVVSDVDLETGEEVGAARLSLLVDEIMASAVRMMRLALKRHGNRARIAHDLVADEKTKVGNIKEKLNADSRIELLTTVLVLWHDLFSSRGWQDEAAKHLWNEYIAKLAGYALPEATGENASFAEYTLQRKENWEKFRPAAAALAADENLRRRLHVLWRKRWEEDDVRWRKQLRWLKDWLFPRGKAANNPSIRKAGGLSLFRIATLTEFRRKVQMGFFSRLKPNGKKDEIKAQFGKGTLMALEHMREQRVKQLASRIAEAALGIGRVARVGENTTPRRPRARVDQPCHAVVIEDLTHYRPEETRTRRENRQLMSWSASKVKKYLAEACQLNGLYLREVRADYTSRQDSRTGAPGVRCQDVPIVEFMQSPFWRKQVAQAEKKLAEGKEDARGGFLCSLNAKWKNKSKTEWKKADAVRIPLKGGEIFVSADPISPTAKGLQADLNAAANIGLQALLDPDWSGRWWYVPCEQKTFKPVKDKVEGSAALRLDEPLKEVPAVQDANNPKTKRGKVKTSSREIVNLWRDVSSREISTEETWCESAPYWNDVQARVVKILYRRAGLVVGGENRNRLLYG